MDKIREFQKRVCRGCDTVLPKAFLDLGLTPLANSYVAPENRDKPEPAFPLAVVHCPVCNLVQIDTTVPPEQLFSEYAYFSSYSEHFLNHAREMADHLVHLFRLGPGSRVLEIASNDGYLLQYFQPYKISVLGVEPAKNIAAHAVSRGIPTMNRFFSPDVIEDINREFGLANLIIGNNVLAHVSQINEFLSAVRSCLAPSGHAVFEFPYLMDLLDNAEFDTVYHEHIFYFSLSAIRSLARKADLKLVDVERIPVHGGTLRVYLTALTTSGDPTPAVDDLLHLEQSAGLTSPARFEGFGQEVNAVRRDLLELLRNLKDGGATIAAYGAPAKGNTLLNYCKIGTELIDFTVDRSPHKQGRLLPGSHIPILAPEELVRRMPDYAVILPWNISDEIMAQQRSYTERGGKFIIPIPRPRVAVADSDATRTSLAAG